MSSRRPQDIFSRYLQDVFSVIIFCLPRRLQKVIARRLQDVLEDVELLHWRHLQDVFKTNKCLLVNSVNNINHNDTHTSGNSNNSGPSLTHSSIYRPPKSSAFPKTTKRNRERHCQYQWFKDYKCLHHDERKDSVFSYFCIKHHAKLSAEHNKDPACVSIGFRNWKKAPKRFKDHEQSKCHTAALAY